MKSSLLLYTTIIRPLITYADPVWAAAFITKINKIQILQNKFLKICLKALCFMRNRQIHNDTGIPLINTWSKIQLKNYHVKLKNLDSARHYNIGRKTPDRRLRPRLPQHILLTDIENSSSKNEDHY
jgi:hypothetical protein